MDTTNQWKTPPPDHVNCAVALLVHPEQYRHFFDWLKNPEWIAPLKEKGFFTAPPGPIEDRMRGATGFPLWPESRYLARMANLRPKIISEIILAIPVNHRNLRVYEDLADAALNMPPEYAARLAEKACLWMSFFPHPLLIEKLLPLCTRLAQAGKADAALGLAGEILEVLPGKPSKGCNDEQQLPAELRARMDLPGYEQVLKSLCPLLLHVAGLRALELFCVKLEKALSLSVNKTDPPEPSESSQLWRPAIEDSEQSPSQGLKNLLVTAVRDAAERLAQDDASGIAYIIYILEGRQWKVFHRISLHLLRRFDDAVPGLVEERLTNRALFDDPEVRHEHILFVKRHFRKLPQEGQKMILQWIEECPDHQYLKEVRNSCF
ncbi:MAG: hypothetical protein WC291_07900 [Thermodesulfovibrionales bacterium]|jgi:hypothetical protein